MKKLLLILLLATPALATKTHNFKDSALNDEFDNNYYEHKYPNWVNARGSSVTVTYINTSSITIKGVNFTGVPTTVSASSVTGTTTNDNATIGRIGEYVASSILPGSPSNAPSNSTYGDLTSISLGAGDWDVSTIGTWVKSGATSTEVQFGISTTSGNSATGLIEGNTMTDSTFTLAYVPLVIPVVRISLATTSTVYFKYLAVYSAGTPTAFGRISARRVR